MDTRREVDGWDMPPAPVTIGGQTFNIWSVERVELLLTNPREYRLHFRDDSPHLDISIQQRIDLNAAHRRASEELLTTDPTIGAVRFPPSAIN